MLIAFAPIAFAGSGCASLPPGAAAVDSVRIAGNHGLSSSEIEPRLATTASPKFLGLFRGVVFDYEIFDRSVLQRDLERVARYYRARGYYQTEVRAGRVRHDGDEHARGRPGSPPRRRRGLPEAGHALRGSLVPER
jgi:outer membrane protein insertion porin family/translocation and assembly module TamA